MFALCMEDQLRPKVKSVYEPTHAQYSSVSFIVSQQMCNFMHFHVSLLLFRFNVIVYSTGVQLWRPGLVPATPENRHEACQWFANQSGGGSSCLMDALKVILASTYSSA